MPTDKPRGFFTALIIGALSLPVAAIAMSQGTDTAETSTPTVAAEVAEAVPDSPPATMIEPGVEEACRADGLALVEKEADGTITSLEQAALDALRPICQRARLALPASPGQAASGGASQTAGQATQPSPATTAAPTTTQPQTQWALGEYPVIGGTAGIEFSIDAARVAFTNENPGFKAEVNQKNAQTIEIRFKSSGHDSIINVSMSGGEWSVTTTEQPKGGGGGDHDDDDDDDERREDHDDDDDGDRDDDD